MTNNSPRPPKAWYSTDPGYRFTVCLTSGKRLREGMTLEQFLSVQREYIPSLVRVGVTLPGKATEFWNIHLTKRFGTR